MALGAQEHQRPALNENAISLGFEEPAGMVSAATAGGTGYQGKGRGKLPQREGTKNQIKLLRISDTWAQACRRRRN